MAGQEVQPTEKVDHRKLPRRKAGRPAITWVNDHTELARKVCRLGATNEDLARFFEVSVAQITHWLQDKPEFRAAVFEGREYSDAHVADALFHRAVGYKTEAVKIFMVKETQGEGEDKVTTSRPELVPFIENYPPDTEAAKFWLLNRAPEKWKRSQEQAPGTVVNIDNRSVNITQETPPEEAAKSYQRLLGRE